MEILLILPGFILAIMVIYDIKLRKPQNKVRFFITCHKVLGLEHSEWILWLGKPYLSNSGRYVSKFKKGVAEIANNVFINRFGLKIEDYVHMKDGEIREVFLNLED